MSLSFPSSGGWDPSSQKTLGWRGSSTRRAGPVTEPVAPAARWQRLRDAAPVPLPSLETPVSAPPPSFDTQDSALRATQQFQQGERDGQLCSQLDLLTSVSRATRTAIESTASLVRTQNAVSEKKTNFLAEEIRKVRRAVHTTDARREISKQGAHTVETVKEVLKSFAVAQEKALGKAISAISDVDERLKWTEDTIGKISLLQKNIAATQKKQDERLRSMGDSLGKLLHFQGLQERQAKKERRERREWQAKHEREFCAKRRKQSENADAKHEQAVDGPRERGESQKNSNGEVKKYESVGRKQLVQNGIGQCEYSLSSEEVESGGRSRKMSVKRRNVDVENKGSVGSIYQMATVYSFSDSSTASRFGMEAGEMENDKRGAGISCDEEDADSLFLEDSVKKESIPAESFPLSTPGEAPWMYESGMNDREIVETFPTIPMVLRRKRPAQTTVPSSDKRKTRRKR